MDAEANPELIEEIRNLETKLAQEKDKARESR